MRSALTRTAVLGWAALFAAACAPSPNPSTPSTPTPSASTAHADPAVPPSAPSGGAADGCVNSGGKVDEGRCCAGAGDFPDTCATGTCSCEPSTKVKIRVCRCPEDHCFDGKSCKRS